MEAKVEKKPLDGGTFKTWKQRLWKINDRRLIQYDSTCSKWEHCQPSKIKMTLDLAHMTHVAFYPKQNPKPNLLQIKHPKLPGQISTLLLRFDADKSEQDTMRSWLKVMTSWGRNRKKNQIYEAIPSNYGYALWTVICALYDHPHVFKTEGLFRISGSLKGKKQSFCSALLYETISLQRIKEKYYGSDDVHLLAKSLQHLLSNLPGSLFGDHNLEDLLKEIQDMDIELLNDSKKMKNGQHFDDDVAHIPRSKLQSLKEFIDNLYIAPTFKGRHEHRWKLIGVILQFLKLVSMKEKETKMSVHAIARLFALCFESRQYLQQMRDVAQPLRCTLLVKVLIYHSFFLFPQVPWSMKDIVVAEKQEAATIQKYNELQLTRNNIKDALPSSVQLPPTFHFNSNFKINNIQNFDVPKYTKKSSKSKHAKDDRKSAEKQDKLDRYKSVDDLDIGSLMQRQHDTNISTMDDEDGDSPKHKRFEKIRRSHNRTSSRMSTISLAKNLSLGDIGNEAENEPGGNGPDLTNMVEVGTFVRNRSHSQPKNVLIPQLADSRCNGWRVRSHSKITSLSEPGYFRAEHGEDEYILLICNHREDGRQCWKYNVKSRSYHRWTKYPDFVGIENCTISVDAHRRRLMLVGSDAQFAELQKINETPFKWKEHGVWINGKFNQSLRAKHGLIECGSDPSSIYIPGPIHQFHVVGGMKSNHHLRWDDQHQKLVTLHQFDFLGIRGHRLLFVDNEWNVAFRSKLLLLGGSAQFQSSSQRGGEWIDCDHILCADIRPHQTQCVWTPLEVKLPRKMAYFGAVVYRHCFLVLFGGRTRSERAETSSIVVWYLNLNSMQWTQSKVKCPRRLKGRESFHAVMTRDERVHLFVSGGNGHFTMRMKDVIPEQEVSAALEEQERVYMEKRQRMGMTPGRKSKSEKSKSLKQKESSMTPGAPPGDGDGMKPLKGVGFPVNHLPIFSDDEQPDDGHDEEEEEEDAPPVYELDDNDTRKQSNDNDTEHHHPQKLKQSKQTERGQSSKERKRANKEQKVTASSDANEHFADSVSVTESKAESMATVENKSRKSKKKKKEKKRSSTSLSSKNNSKDPHGSKRRKSSSKHSKKRSSHKSSKGHRHKSSSSSSHSKRHSRDRHDHKSTSFKGHKYGKRQKAHPENPGTSHPATTNKDELHTVRSDVHGNVQYDNVYSDYSPEGGHRTKRNSTKTGIGRGGLGATDIVEGRFNCTVFYEWMAGLCTMGPPMQSYSTPPRLDHSVYDDYDDESVDFEPGSFDDSYHSNQSYDY